MKNNSKILITGADNMLGFQILKNLISKGKNPIVILNKNQNNSHLNEYIDSINIVYANILNVIAIDEAMQGIEKIYHCQEYCSFLPQDRLKLYDINITGTRNIVNVAISNKVKKIVFASSSLAFGTCNFRNSITEKTKWKEHKYNSYYSICKQRAELEIHRAQAEGLETIIVNPSIIIGSAIKKTDLYNFKNIAKAHYSFYPKVKSGFVLLEDVSNIFIKLMESNISDEKFIISSENLEFKDVLEKLNTELKKKKLFPRTNSLKLSLIWRINWLNSMLFGSRPFLSKEIYNFNNKNFEVDNSKIIETLGFTFKKVL